MGEFRRAQVNYNLKLHTYIWALAYVIHILLTAHIISIRSSSLFIIGQQQIASAFKWIEIGDRLEENSVIELFHSDQLCRVDWPRIYFIQLETLFQLFFKFSLDHVVITWITLCFSPKPAATSCATLSYFNINKIGNYPFWY